jgi:hypothetical protein
MPTRLPGLTGANGIRLPIRGGKHGGTRVPGLLVFSSLGPSEEVRLSLTTSQPTWRTLVASHRAEVIHVLGLLVACSVVIHEDSCISTTRDLRGASRGDR